MILTVVVTRARESREAGYMMPGLHILTPGTDDSTLYWTGTLHAEHQIPLAAFRKSFFNTFGNEDKPMIEHVVRAMDGRTDLLAMPLLLRTDAGSVLAHRVLAELSEQEQSRPEPMPIMVQASAWPGAASRQSLTE